MVGIAFICCTFVAKIKCHLTSCFCEFFIGFLKNGCVTIERPIWKNTYLKEYHQC